MLFQGTDGLYYGVGFAPFVTKCCRKIPAVRRSESLVGSIPLKKPARRYPIARIKPSITALETNS